MPDRPGGMHVCNRCVDVGMIILAGSVEPPASFDPENWPTERLLATLGALDATAGSCRRHPARAAGALRSRGVSWA